MKLTAHFLLEPRYRWYGVYLHVLYAFMSWWFDTRENLTHGKKYFRGGQLDQLRESHFTRQQSARDMYWKLKFIKSNTLGFDWRTPYWACTNRFNCLPTPNLRRWPLIQNYNNETKYFVLKPENCLRYLARAECGSWAALWLPLQHTGLHNPQQCWME
jgi:hypothetical protein